MNVYTCSRRKVPGPPVWPAGFRVLLNIQGVSCVFTQNLRTHLCIVLNHLIPH